MIVNIESFQAPRTLIHEFGESTRGPSRRILLTSAPKPRVTVQDSVNADMVSVSVTLRSFSCCWLVSGFQHAMITVVCYRGAGLAPRPTDTATGSCILAPKTTVFIGPQRTYRVETW